MTVAQQRRLRARGAAGCRARRSSAACRRSARARRPRRLWRPPSEPALRRAAAARGARAHAGDRAAGAASRRAAFESRREAARADAPELQRLHERLGITTIFVTHDQEEAMTICDRIARDGPGRDPADRHADGLFDNPPTASSPVRRLGQPLRGRVPSGRRVRLCRRSASAGCSGLAARPPRAGLPGVSPARRSPRRHGRAGRR